MRKTPITIDGTHYVNSPMQLNLDFYDCKNDNFNTLKSELSTAKTYEFISTDEKSVVTKHCSDIETKFAVGITESQEKLPTFIGYQNFINDLTKLVLLQTLAHVQLY